jgi:hypothetical protein
MSKRDGLDVIDKESGIIAPYGICTFWYPDEDKAYLGIIMFDLGRKIKEAVGAVDNLSKFEQLSKLKASYVEFDKFADSNHRDATIVFIGLILREANAMLVKHEGPDVMGKKSKVIAPHDCCAGYEANFDKLNDIKKAEQYEKVTTKDVT